MKSLIIGAGQVGTALKEILGKTKEVYIRDIEDIRVPRIDVLHICYPDHDGFEKTTKSYVNKYKPSLVIIHSSVGIGTTEKCGEDYVYSPVRGRHPKLSQEMDKFVVFVSSRNFEKAEMAYKYLNESGFICVVSDSPSALEFYKTISNAHMGLEIAWRQEVERMIEKEGFDSSEYDLWERTYRDGCLSVEDYNLIRPTMKPDPIGGHCILPCTDILKKRFKSKLLDFITESNERAKNERLVAN